MELLNKLQSIRDIKQKVDLYDKIIKQKLDYDIEILYQLALLDSEMNQDDEDLTENHIIKEDSVDSLSPQICPGDDETQKVLTQIFLPNEDLKKNDVLNKNLPEVSWDPVISDKDKIKVVKAKTPAPRRSRAKKGKN